MFHNTRSDVSMQKCFLPHTASCLLAWSTVSYGAATTPELFKKHSLRFNGNHIFISLTYAAILLCKNAGAVFYIENGAFIFGK